MKLQLKLLILSFFISIIGYSQTISVSGTIATNTIWNVDTVKVTGDIIVNDLVTLTVNPHTYVEFQGYYQITVFGRMLAIGNVTDTISFAINDTTGFSNTSTTTGGWNSINISILSPVNDSSIFEYCKMTNCKQISIWALNCKIRVEHCLFYNNNVDLETDNPGRPIVRNNYFRNSNYAIGAGFGSAPLITYNFFTNNYTAIEVSGCSPEISYNTISNNFMGINASALFASSLIHNNSISYNSEGIYLLKDTNTIVSNNIINHNSSTIFTGGSIHISESSSVIINNIIAYNSAQGGGGIFIDEHSSPLIIFNKIANNDAMGTGCGLVDGGAGILCVTSSALIINNLISNNTTESNGGGIGSVDSSSVTIINNTIVNNKSNNINGGGGIALWYYGIANLNDNIIWGNEAPASSKQIFAHNESFNIDYNDISDTINSFGYVGINYQHLMMSDPKFMSPSAGAGIAYDGLSADWSLQSISPCINAGNPDTTGLHLYSTDIFGVSRILNDTIDIGAYEYNPSLSIREINNFINNNLLVYPNPANEDINIIVKNVKSAIFSLKITNVLGQVVYEENVGSTTTFFYKTVNVSGFSKGMYSISLTDNKGMSYSKLIVKE